MSGEKRCGCAACEFAEYSVADWSPGRSVATDSTEADHEPYARTVVGTTRLTITGEREGGSSCPDAAPDTESAAQCWCGSTAPHEHGRGRPLGAPAPPAPEATGEMSDSVVAALVGMIAPQRGEDADDRYSRERAIKELLDGVAALRTRAREAEEREAKWRRELSAACELSERAREIVVSALNQPPEHFYDKHDNGEWSAEHIAFAIRSLFAERDEAREQLALCTEQHAAANARAEEAERKADERAAKEIADWRDEVVKRAKREMADALDDERAARLRAEAEVASLKAEIAAGLDVAAEHRKHFRERAERAEAEVRAEQQMRHRSEAEVSTLRERLAAAEARIARLVEIGDVMAGPDSYLSLELARGRWRSARAAKADAPAAGGGR